MGQHARATVVDEDDVALLPGEGVGEKVGKRGQRLGGGAWRQHFEDGEGTSFVRNEFFDASDGDVELRVADSERHVALVFDNGDASGAGDDGVCPGDGGVAVLEEVADNEARGTIKRFRGM